MGATPDWGIRGEYIATRSARRPGDTDIDPAWADEAYTDEATGRLPATMRHEPSQFFTRGG